MKGQLALSELRMETVQVDHVLRSLLFGDGSSTSGLVRGEHYRLAVADELNRLMDERLELVNEIAVLRSRVVPAAEEAGKPPSGEGR